MGKQENEWQTTDSILELFGSNLSQARHNYHEYVAAGKKLGKQPGFTGGGLIRSAGGFGYRESAECEYMKGVPLALPRTTASDGKQYKVAHYNLDMMLAHQTLILCPGKKNEDET